MKQETIAKLVRGLGRFCVRHGTGFGGLWLAILALWTTVYGVSLLVPSVAELLGTRSVTAAGEIEVRVHYLMTLVYLFWISVFAGMAAFPFIAMADWIVRRAQWSKRSTVPVAATLLVSVLAVGLGIIVFRNEMLTVRLLMWCFAITMVTLPIYGYSEQWIGFIWRSVGRMLTGKPATGGTLQRA